MGNICSTGFETVTIRPLRRQFLASELPLTLLLLLLAVIPGVDSVPVLHRRIAAYAALAVALILLLRYIRLRAMRFDIGAEQLVFRHGVFSIRRDYIELYRVYDYEENRGFVQVLLGVKTVVVISGDHTSPELYIPGVPASFDLVSVLRARVEYNKKNKGIYEITNR